HRCRHDPLNTLGTESFTEHVAFKLFSMREKVAERPDEGMNDCAKKTSPTAFAGPPSPDGRWFMISNEAFG
ncbi:MAG: hypothetical protein ACO3QB_12355, partial [bacterium]